MSPEEYYKLRLENVDVLLIDIRELYEFEHENIGALHIPLGDFLERLNEIPRDKKVVLHCQTGSRAAKLTAVLHNMGYEHVSNLDGGIEAFLNLLESSSHE